MALRSSLAFTLPIAAAMLAGCAVDGEFPSLAPRPRERELSIVEPHHAPVAVPSDPSLLLRVAELRRQAARGESDFDAAYGAADAATARAGAPESETWIEAQQALSRLEAARGAVTAALAHLDQLATQRADVPTNGEDYAAIQTAFAAVREIAERQEARLERLRARLSR